MKYMSATSYAAQITQSMIVVGAYKKAILIHAVIDNTQNLEYLAHL